MFSILFGIVLAIVEGWTFSESFVELAFSLAQCKATVVRVDPPSFFFGKLVACIVSLFVKGLFAVFYWNNEWAASFPLGSIFTTDGDKV